MEALSEANGKGKKRKLEFKESDDSVEQKRRGNKHTYTEDEIDSVVSASGDRDTPAPSYLKNKNPHTRDSTVRFYDNFDGRTHVYLVDWEKNGLFEVADMSVSSLYKQYFPPFEADLIITKMRNGTKWTSSKYYNMTNDEIKAQWTQLGSDAAQKGSDHHLKCERYYNGTPLQEPYNKPTEQFVQFTKDHQHLKPFRTEWILRSDAKHKVCGTPDMIMFSPQCTDEDTLGLTIFDWKNSKQIKKFNMWERGFPPFDNLPNCNYFHYAIQLNAYKYMIETFYAPMEVDGVVYKKIKIDKMFLVVMHENRDTYLKLLLPDYQDLVKQIFDLRELELLEKQTKPTVFLETSNPEI